MKSLALVHLRALSGKQEEQGGPIQPVGGCYSSVSILKAGGRALTNSRGSKVRTDGSQDRKPAHCGLQVSRSEMAPLGLFLKLAAGLKP